MGCYMQASFSHGVAYWVVKAKEEAHVAQEVFCDLGTDCSDCGRWVHLLPAAAEVATPVADLRELGIQVFTKWTRTLPSFLMAYTNPDHDVDVSGQMHFNSNIELGLTQVLP